MRTFKEKIIICVMINCVMSYLAGCGMAAAAELDVTDMDTTEEPGKSPSNQGGTRTRDTETEAGLALLDEESATEDDEAKQIEVKKPETSPQTPKLACKLVDKRAGMSNYNKVYDYRTSQYFVRTARAAAASPMCRGTLKCGEDPRFEMTKVTSDMVEMLNISTTFDTSSMNCVTCEKRHVAIADNSKATLVLSDQCFPPSIPVTDGGKCLAIVRIEDGTLLDLAKWFKRIAKKLAPGSTIIISSGTQLLRMGISAYAANLQSAIRMIREDGPKDIKVIHGPILPMEGCKNFGWVAAIADLAGWLTRAAEEDRDNHLYHTHSVLIGALKKAGTGTNKCPTESMVLMPISLYNRAPAIVQLGGGTDLLPVEVGPISEELEAEVVMTMVHELNRKLNCGLSPRINLSRARKPALSSDGIIIIGADHAARMRVAAVEMGLQSHYIGLNSCKADEVQAACEKLSDTLANMGDAEKANTTVIIQILDNGAYVSQDEDGHIHMPETDEKGVTHMIGSIDLGPMGSILRNADAAKPIIAIASTQNVVMVAPFPRYHNGVGCCDNINHSTNIHSDNFRKDQERGIAAIKNKLNTSYVEGKIWNCRAHNVIPDLDKFGSGSQQGAYDAEDPTHPPLAAYQTVVRGILATSKLITAKNEAKASKRGADKPSGLKRTNSDDGSRQRLAPPPPPAAQSQRVTSGPRAIPESNRFPRGPVQRPVYRYGQTQDVREEMRATARVEYDSYADVEGEVYAPSPNGREQTNRDWSSDGSRPTGDAIRSREEPANRDRHHEAERYRYPDRDRHRHQEQRRDSYPRSGYARSGGDGGRWDDRRGERHDERSSSRDRGGTGYWLYVEGAGDGREPRQSHYRR